MSNKEIAKKLIDQIPENRLYYVIAYLQGASILDELPNDDTISAIKELEAGSGTPFPGTTEALFSELMED